MTGPAARRGEHGFSLLELLVVMIIIATLMAILIPTFLGQKRGSVNASTIAAAQTFEAAAAEYLRSYPVVALPDPLASRGGSTQPFSPTMKPHEGLYGIAGDPLVKSWPTNPFTRQPVRVLRGSCNAPPSLGDVLLCRPTLPGGGPDYQLVRVIAWGRNGAGSTVVVYDTQACNGRCRIT